MLGLNAQVLGSVVTNDCRTLPGFPLGHFNPIVAAPAYAATTGILAAISIAALVVLIERHDATATSDERGNALALLVVVAVILITASFLYVEVSGETNCANAMAELTIAGGAFAIGAAGAFLGLGWLLSIYEHEPVTYSAARLAFVLVVAIASLFCMVSLDNYETMWTGHRWLAYFHGWSFCAAMAAILILAFVARSQAGVNPQRLVLTTARVMGGMLVVIALSSAVASGEAMDAWSQTPPEWAPYVYFGAVTAGLCTMILCFPRRKQEGVATDHELVDLYGSDGRVLKRVEVLVAQQPVVGDPRER